MTPRTYAELVAENARQRVRLVELTVDREELAARNGDLLEQVRHLAAELAAERSSQTQTTTEAA